jgi:hypothetical protein
MVRIPQRAKRSNAWKWVMAAAAFVVVGLLIAGLFLERNYGALDPFADGMHAAITNDTSAAVTLRDATGTYDFVIAPGSQRKDRGPDYSHPQDALTFEGAGGVKRSL